MFNVIYCACEEIYSLIFYQTKEKEKKNSRQWATPYGHQTSASAMEEGIKKNILLLLIVCVCVFAHALKLRWEVEVDVRSPGAGVSSICGLLYVGAGNQTYVLYRSRAH